MVNSNNPHTYDVLIEKLAEHGYRARVLTWPDCVVEAPTRAAALAQIRAMILEQLAQGEIVTLTITPEEIAHSWLPFAGDWADDPGIEDFRASIAAYRREMDAQWSPWMLEPETREATADEPIREVVAA